MTLCSNMDFLHMEKLFNLAFKCMIPLVALEGRQLKSQLVYLLLYMLFSVLL